SECNVRRAELPPRDAPIVVVSDDPDQAAAAAEDLRGMGYTLVTWLERPLETLAGGLADRGPASRMWRPAPFLEEVLPQLPPGRARSDISCTPASCHPASRVSP